MRGKFVNICMALLNLFLGAIIIIYVINVPSDITEFTVQELQVINISEILIYVLFGVATFLNIIHFFLDRRNNSRRTGYLIAVFSVSFIFIRLIPIAVFCILGGLIILFSTLKIHWIETNSFTAISLIIILTILGLFIIAISFLYEDIGTYIRDKENEDETAYKDTYFKYITELEEDNEIYINVERDGKFGYVNLQGETVIDFEYDYASPFVSITAYDKNFDIALVCKDGRTLIILKNKREVLTYQTESLDDNYAAKIAELEDIYYNTLGQTEEMTFEIVSSEISSICKVPSYGDISSSYSYRYDLNDEYDLIITESSLGLENTYELAYKSDLSIRITLDCEELDYDENYLYIYRNGNIPFYDVSQNKQGWFTSYGRKVTLSGNAQILDFFDDYILIKNHNDDTIYFINEDGEIVSDIYKEVYICNDNRFIVKNENNKYIVIDLNFEKVFDGEWDFVDTSFLSSGFYVFGTVSDIVTFSDFDYAENLNFQMLDENGNTIIDNVQQIYNLEYKISDDSSLSYSERYSNFLSDLKSVNVSYVGDQFYE